MPGLNKIHLPLKTFQADSFLKRIKKGEVLSLSLNRALRYLNSYPAIVRISPVD